MKKAGIISVVFMINLLILSCSGKQSINSDSYHKGTDFQYFQTSQWYRRPKIQETENGCVFMLKDFLYIYENKTDSILPLCSKANCLHDKEKDPEKLKECSAHVDAMVTNMTKPYSDITLMYYKDWIYICYPVSADAKDSQDGMCRVYRVSMDGSSKDLVYQQKNMQYPLLHRGYLYYYTYDFAVAESGLYSRIALLRINVEDTSPKPEVIRQSDSDIRSHGELTAYGNYVYFSFTDEVSDRDRVFCYNIESREISVFGDPGSHITGYHSNMYYLYYYTGKDDLYLSEVSKVAADGSTKEEVIPNIEQGKMLMSDEKYLYITNGWLSVDMSFAEERDPEVPDLYVWVYDDRMDLVDEYAIPDTNDEPNYEQPPGGEVQYMRLQDEEIGEYGLYIWDKSDIGTLHGKAYSQRKVLYSNAGQ